MPKLRPYTEEGKFKKKCDEFDTKLRGELARVMAEKSMDYKDVSILLHVSLPTMYNRRRNPGSFTLAEQRRLKAAFPDISIV